MACVSFDFSFSVNLLKCHNFLNIIAGRKKTCGEIRKEDSF